jgi:hypothetical protein
VTALLQASYLGSSSRKLFEPKKITAPQRRFFSFTDKRLSI